MRKIQIAVAGFALATGLAACASKPLISPEQISRIEAAAGRADAAATKAEAAARSAADAAAKASAAADKAAAGYKPGRK